MVHILMLSQLLDDLNPPTKIVGRFLKTWRDRHQYRSQYSQTPSLSNKALEDAAGHALTLSRRLIGIFKLKRILNIEAGLEMIALAMTISSEVSEIRLQMISSV